MEKMELMSKVCLYVGYLKKLDITTSIIFLIGMHFFSTNAAFLGNKYIEEPKSSSNIILEGVLEKVQTTRFCIFV